MGLNLQGTQGQVFGPSGTNHSQGLVPDPGGVSGTSRFLREDATFAVPPGITVNQTLADIEIIIDGGGSQLTTGIKGYCIVDFACTINQSTLLADQSGSVVLDIFKCTFAQFDASVTHPVAADKITASAPPTITTATKAQDSTLAGWTTTINAGDILAFSITSVTSITRLTSALKITKS